MILYLKLECFRKHVNREFTFTRGMNTIRGANEDGKTTLLLAILYALYGAKVMPLPMEEMVTWGESLKRLKVTLTILVGGREFTFTRSASGAECNFTGGVVTGQAEVTKFAASILGANADKAQKLMFASQKGLSAAIEGGAASISAYIEELSGMNLFDELLELASEHWATGPTTTLDVAIGRLEGEVENVPAAPNLAPLQSALDLIENELETAEATLNGYLQNKVNEALINKSMMDERKAAVAEKKQASHAATAEYRRVCTEMETAAKQANMPVDEERIAELERMINDQAAHKERLTAYTKFAALPKCDQVWDDTHDSMEQELKSANSKSIRLQNQIAEYDADLRVLSAKRINETACGLCGKDLTQVPEVVKKNADITQQEVQVAQRRKALIAEYSELGDTIAALQEIEFVHAKASAFAATYPTCVSRDDSEVPVKLTWLGEVPQDIKVDAGMTKELANLNETKRLKDRAAIRLPDLQDSVARALKAVDAATDALTAATDAMPNEAEVLANVQKAQAAHREQLHLVQDLRRRQAEAGAKIGAAASDYQRALQAYETAKKQLADLKQEREERVFHNGVVKKIKQARPIVAAKLWSIVLASVSTMFSKLRGDKSIVSRDADEFKVNGKPAKAVSGSTIDILGLAMRVALVRTFIPTCAFLVLDEPMAACDDDRSAALVAFVNACGFDQVILVTHEEVSDSMTDNLIIV